MAAPVELTWDIAGDAHRASLAECGGAALVNEVRPNEPMVPDDGTFPEAKWLNQLQKQVAATNRIQSSATMTIDLPGSVPGIVGLMAPGLSVVSTDLTLTDGGLGVTTISWAAGKLPSMICDPELTINATGNNSGVAIRVSATSVRVETRTGGVLADLRFTLRIN